MVNSMKKDNDELDIDTLLERQEISLPEILQRLPEEQQPEVLRCYIENQLPRFKSEKLYSGFFRKTKEFLSEQDTRLLDALAKLRFRQDAEDLFEYAMPLIDSVLRSRLGPWLNYSSTLSSEEYSIEQYKEDYFDCYFDVLSRMRTWGYALTDNEAARLILDSLADEFRKEGSSFQLASRNTYNQPSIMYFEHSKIENCMQVIGWCEDIGWCEKNGAEFNRTALINFLYELFIFPLELSTCDREFGDKVVLVSLEDAVDIIGQRFELLEMFESKGYAIEYQQVADHYTKGLQLSQFLAVKGGDGQKSKLGKPAKAVLGHLELLEKKGADLSETYKQLAGDAIEAINEGRKPQRCLPLLEFLAKHDAFDSSQLALLRALSKP